MKLEADRRIARSSRPAEALALLLEHASRKLGIRALTLSTTEGQLILGVGEGLEEVAEAGARVDTGAPVDARVATWRLRVGTAEMLLTSLGGAMDPGLGAGVRRILSTS